MTPQRRTYPDIESDFANSAQAKLKSKKRLAPLSVRLSQEQRSQLERDAVGMSLNAYVLSKLFDDPAAPMKPRRERRAPTKRDKAIARALRRMSHSGIAAYLVSRIVAREEGRLVLSPEEEMQLREAYADCVDLPGKSGGTFDSLS